MTKDITTITWNEITNLAEVSVETKGILGEILDAFDPQPKPILPQFWLNAELHSICRDAMREETPESELTLAVLKAILHYKKSL